jgi:hypothetical protein
MTKQIEIVDALCGSGKTHGIFDYMAKNQGKPYLYLSPMKQEIDVRVALESDRVDMVFYTAKDDDGRLAPQILEFLREGYNIACTHALTLHFKQEHIDLIKLQEYQIICDEELNLIDAFKISKQDIDFLYSEKMLSKDVENLGRMSFLKTEMSDEARYGDIKRLCDRGCLYGEKNSNNMLVTYLSPDLVLNADRFILLTYNFSGSIMQAFLELHKISHKPLVIPLRVSNSENKQKVKGLIEFVEPPSVKKFLEKQTRFNLSSSWWESNNVRSNGVNPDDVRKLINSLHTSQKVPKSEIFFTIPLGSFSKIKTRNVPFDNMIACNMRATNELAHKTYAIHAFNIFNNVTVKSYLNSYGYDVDEEAFALNQAIQWLFRGCIRDGKPMNVTFLSKRMKELFVEWLG